LGEVAKRERGTRFPAFSYRGGEPGRPIKAVLGTAILHATRECGGIGRERRDHVFSVIVDV